MPDETFVYVGPYAEWVVPEALPGLPDLPPESVEELAGDVLDGEALFIAGIQWGRVEAEGRPCRVYFGLAWEDRPRAPAPPVRARANRDTQGYLLPFEPVDLRGRDCEAEIDWFRSAFAAELDRASVYFGHPPVFRWGLVTEQHW